MFYSVRFPRSALSAIGQGDLMHYFRTCSCILTYPLLALFLFTTVPLMPAQAALIGTEDVLQQRDLSAARKNVELFLERQDVREQVAAFGVSPREVEARVAALSDEEITRIAGKIDQMPAGQNPLGWGFTIVLIILLVLLVTDILGVTNVLPFV